MEQLAEAWKSKLTETQSSLARKGAGGGGGLESITVPVTPGVTTDLPAVFGTTVPSMQPFMAPQATIPVQVPVEAASTKPRWFKNVIFIQFACCVAVFLVSLVALVTIRPPFLNRKPDPENKLEMEKFSAARAFYFSLGAGILCAVVLVIIAMIRKIKPGLIKIP